jgi:acylphosphatase
MTFERDDPRQASPAPRMLRVVVSGRVQGVGFRWHVREAARRAGVTGWVRNRPDGTVEVQVAGVAHAVDAVLEAVRRGPPAARVEHVKIEPATDAEWPPTFSVR